MAEPILKVENLVKVYKKKNFEVQAVNNVNFSIAPGEILGVVGESGSGKSTIARVISLLEPATAGKIIFDGEDITKCTGKSKMGVYRKMQMVFQDAIGSFDPRMKIGHSIAEIIKNLEPGITKAKIKECVESRLVQVGLKPEYSDRYPYELSGGECQRAAFARAIALQPKFLIADEVTSALDVSAQAQIVELMKKLCVEMNVAMLFISHDLALVSSVCSNVLVMHKGNSVEQGSVKDVICNTKQEYTKTLLSNILTIDWKEENKCEIM
ncbi:MAG: dipeptide/oligopeptide/nickel ABC transporter ATP-binding protein [Clostridiaceae bacterium]